jgi:proteasome activator subunit 4
MATNLLNAIISATGIDLNDYLSESEDGIDMSDDESINEPGGDHILSPEQSAFEKQHASLQIYLNSVPYECETVEEMQAKLEDIVGKIMICAEAKNWLLLTTWDGMLQWSVLALPHHWIINNNYITVAGFLCVIPCPKRRAPSSSDSITSYVLYPGWSHASFATGQICFHACFPTNRA